MYQLFTRICVFFFKQKTAYEMRISDWSSDVCSSDLLDPGRRFGTHQVEQHPFLAVIGACGIARRGADTAILFADQRRIVELLALGIAPQLGADVLVQPLGERTGKAVGDRFQDRKSVV